MMVLLHTMDLPGDRSVHYLVDDVPAGTVGSMAAWHGGGCPGD
jgi:hypothetical protein